MGKGKNWTVFVKVVVGVSDLFYCERIASLCWQ